MTPVASNPLLAPWDTPYGLPPFDRVAPEHFRPAFDEALAQQRARALAGAEAALFPWCVGGVARGAGEQ